MLTANVPTDQCSDRTVFGRTAERSSVFRRVSSFLTRATASRSSFIFLHLLARTHTLLSYRRQSVGMVAPKSDDRPNFILIVADGERDFPGSVVDPITDLVRPRVLGHWMFWCGDQNAESRCFGERWDDLHRLYIDALKPNMTQLTPPSPHRCNVQSDSRDAVQWDRLPLEWPGNHGRRETRDTRSMADSRLRGLSQYVTPHLRCCETGCQG